MIPWPSVASEMETLDLVLSGKSLSRYGDGEFKICRGSSIKSQNYHPELCRRLNEILQASGECLVGIPNILAPQGLPPEKAAFWSRVQPWAEILLSDRPYVSSFVSRADSAPWINSEAYWDKVEQLWRGRNVTIVRGSGKAFTPDLMPGAGEITEIIGPRSSAWSDYESLMERIGKPERVLLALGPAATVMAVDLCAKGVHAIDVGHMGAFYRRREQEAA